VVATQDYDMRLFELDILALNIGEDGTKDAVKCGQRTPHRSLRSEAEIRVVII